ncbi:MAG: hypothetical protein RIB47_03500 [Cyclobacteriaceae bacterium]
MEERKNNNRRGFIKKVLGALATSAMAMPALASTNKSGKTVKMLTSEGKLVEIDESVLSKLKKQKAENKDILNWVNPKI